MTLEFIGMIQPREQSEIHPARGPAIDPGYLVRSVPADPHDAATYFDVAPMDKGEDCRRDIELNTRVTGASAPTRPRCLHLGST